MSCSLRWWNEPDAKDAFYLAWVSIIVELLAAGGGIAAYMRTGSSLMFCFGLENAVDVLSSIVVFWRFFMADGSDLARVAILERRETKASAAISFILFALGVGIIFAAFEDFKLGLQNDEAIPVLLGLSLVSFIVFGSFTAVKLRFSDKLSSSSLQKDAYCSLIGTSLSLSLLVNTVIIVQEPRAWWIDPFVATLVGILSCVLGIGSLGKAMFVQGIPIWSISWWCSDGKHEVTSAETEGHLPDFNVETELSEITQKKDIDDMELI
mmetsp:Transcript_21558/g.31569  ORF Transcript_21558/g.31569 Transcript_21558/m.31569 type:complete len:266 (-) Transcript_21558:269-1066(-)